MLKSQDLFIGKKIFYAVLKLRISALGKSNIRCEGLGLQGSQHAVV